MALSDRFTLDSGVSPILFPDTAIAVFRIAMSEKGLP